MAVNESGELIAKNMPYEGQDDYMICYKNNNSAEIDMQGSVTSAEVINSIKSLWGVELITEMTDGATGSFVLPAKSGKLAQTYQLDYGNVSPEIEDFD